jgi:hypothetical protein
MWTSGIMVGSDALPHRKLNVLLTLLNTELKEILFYHLYVHPSVLLQCTPD